MKEIEQRIKVGIGYRETIHTEILNHADDFTCLEIISEMFFDSKNLPLLYDLLGRFSLLPHGLNLSIASAGLREEYVRDVKKLVDIIDPPYYSDHLSLTNCPGITFNQLTPPFLFKDQLNIVVDNVNFMQDLLQRPLVLENITQLIRFEAEMTAYEFVHQLVERTSCGILLDVTNTYVDSFNYHFNPEDELDKWPLEAVYHIHLSGGRTIGDEKMDGHNAPVEETSWSLFKKYLGRMPNLHTVIIERDENFSDFDQLLAEVSRVKSILAKEILCKN